MATPPGAGPAPAPRPPAAPYAGPPRYRTVPRWGFPPVGWRAATGPPPPVPDVVRMRAHAALAVPLLVLAAVVALAAAAAEAWRYAILLDSRTDAVPGGSLRVSDALVGTAGVLSLLASAVAGTVALLWLVRALGAAAAAAGVRPARSTGAVLAAVGVPGVNLVAPAAVLAEVEHAALGRDPGLRPRPSRLVLVWCAAWAVGLLLVAATLLNATRDGVQARADGVLLHVVVDVVAAVVAVLTAVVVRRTTALVDPGAPDPGRRMVVVRVPGQRPVPPVAREADPARGADREPAAPVG